MIQAQTSIWEKLCCDSPTSRPLSSCNLCVLLLQFHSTLNFFEFMICFQMFQHSNLQKINTRIMMDGDRFCVNL